MSMEIYRALTTCSIAVVKTAASNDNTFMMIYDEGEIITILSVDEKKNHATVESGGQIFVTFIDYFRRESMFERVIAR